MRAVIKLELIGDDIYSYKQKGKRRNDNYELKIAQGMARKEAKPWVARIVGTSEQYGFKREFMHGQRDYANANGTGSRGIYEYIPLTDGIYEVNERLSWKRVRRYFIRVIDSAIEEISREEVERVFSD